MTAGITFVLLREGPSDDGLVDVIGQLITRVSGRQADGVARRLKGSTTDKLAALASEGPGHLDLVFVHRDADSRDHLPRYQEVTNALAAAHQAGVPVIPVQETEAWLLTDEDTIRAVVGNRRGRGDLGLPALAHIEQTANPKELLRTALVRAAESSGKRLRQVTTSFPTHRSRLLAGLDVDGPVRELPSFRRLVHDIEETLAPV